MTFQAGESGMFFYIAGFLMSKLENMKIRYLSKKNSEAVNNRGGGNRR